MPVWMLVKTILAMSSVGLFAMNPGKWMICTSHTHWLLGASGTIYFSRSYLWYHVETQIASYDDGYLRVAGSNDNLHHWFICEPTLVRLGAVYIQHVLCALNGFRCMRARITDVVSKLEPGKKAGVIDGFDGINNTEHLHKWYQVEAEKSETIIST